MARSANIFILKKYKIMFTKFLDKISGGKSFSFIYELFKEFPDCEVYLVGGMIRDEILKRKSKDYDFVVRKIKPKDLKAFLEKRGWVSLVGRNFGVFKFKPHQSKFIQPFDIALPRTEISTGVGYKDFTVQSDPDLPIKEDLSRRDFTINAMALNIKSGKLIDPFNGIGDIKKKIIDTVGSPAARFNEDYSRILRALRFSAQLDFEISLRAWRQIKKLAPKILKERELKGKLSSIVPLEIISAEFLKAFSADPVKSYSLFNQSGIFKILIPEIEAMKNVKQPEEYHREGDVFVHTGICMDNIPADAPIELILGLLFHDIGKPSTIKTPEKDGVDRIRFDEHTDIGADMAAEICRRLRFSKNLTEHVVWLVRNHMLFVAGKVEEMRTATLKKYFIDDPRRGDNLLELYRVDVLSSENEFQPENLQRYQEVKKYIEDTRKAFVESQVETFRHVISGRDIMKKYNIKPGPEVGKILARADEFIFNYISENKKEPSKKTVFEYLKRA